MGTNTKDTYLAAARAVMGFSWSDTAEPGYTNYHIDKEE